MAFQDPILALTTAPQRGNLPTALFLLLDSEYFTDKFYRGVFRLRIFTTLHNAGH